MNEKAFTRERAANESYGKAAGTRGDHKYAQSKRGFKKEDLDIQTAKE